MNDSLDTTPVSPPDIASSTRPHIVVGVDGSDSSINSLRQAAKLATAFGGSVEAVNVWQFPASVIGYFPPDWSPADDAKKILSDSVLAVFGAQPPTWLEQTVLEGSPAKELVAASKGADLLIVGSRGHGGFAGLLLGSGSSVCAEYASCPILVMHGEALFGAAGAE
jgi:nucleotide-binding universal stress UspA family protein